MLTVSDVLLLVDVLCVCVCIYWDPTDGNDYSCMRLCVFFYIHSFRCFQLGANMLWLAWFLSLYSVCNFCPLIYNPMWFSKFEQTKKKCVIGISTANKKKMKQNSVLSLLNHKKVHNSFHNHQQVYRNATAGWSTFGNAHLVKHLKMFKKKKKKTNKKNERRKKLKPFPLVFFFFCINEDR